MHSPVRVSAESHGLRERASDCFVADTVANGMWRYDWPPARVVPERIIAGIKALGVDVTSWGG